MIYPKYLKLKKSKKIYNNKAAAIAPALLFKYWYKNEIYY